MHSSVVLHIHNIYIDTYAHRGCRQSTLCILEWRAWAGITAADRLSSHSRAHTSLRGSWILCFFHHFFYLLEAHQNVR